MVRHVRADDGGIFPLRHTRACVINRLVEAVRTPSACFFEPHKIFHSRDWVNHGCKRSGIRCDDNILAEAPLEPQSGYAKAGVLIGKVEVARIVRRLGHSPRHVSLRTVCNLTTYNQFVRLAQQAPRGGTHHKRRHQVFKHRPRPGDKRGAPIHGCERAA